MTIRLHTGVPGSGKTLSMIDVIEHDSSYSSRVVYAHGIEGWERAVPVRCSHDGCRTCRVLSAEQRASMHAIEDWQNWADVGSLICVDEAHYPFPSRREREAPMYIQRLTEHRHDGIDFWLCTPNANLLDVNVRRLVEQHDHFVKGQMGRFRVRHTEVMDSDDRLRLGVKESFKLPTRTFALYKSADAHVTIKRSIPKAVWKIPALLAVGAAVVALVLYQVGNLRRDHVQQPEVASAPVADVPSDRAPSRFSFRPDSTVGVRALSWENGLVDFEPRIPDYPESAPAYDASPAPARVPPRIAACVATKTACVCYSQQATPIPVSRLSCLEFSSGNAYNPLLSDDQFWPRAGRGAREGAALARPAEDPIDG